MSVEFLFSNETCQTDCHRASSYLRSHAANQIDEKGATELATALRANSRLVALELKCTYLNLSFKFIPRDSISLPPRILYHETAASYYQRTGPTALTVRRRALARKKMADEGRMDG